MNRRAARIGGWVGMTAGATATWLWWYLWACRTCLTETGPAVDMALGALVGGALGVWLGADQPVHDDGPAGP